MKELALKLDKSSIILGVIFLVLIGVLTEFLIPLKIFLIDKDTNQPLANQYIEIMYDRVCVESPCEGVRAIYQGTTDSDGAIWVRMNHALNVNRIHPTYEPVFEYYVNIDGYNRYYDDEAIRNKTYDQNSNIIYIKKNSKETRTHFSAKTARQ